MLVLRGIIVLINLIRIFYLSLLKIFVKVWKDIIKIKRKFFQRGFKDETKVPGVWWSIACKTKQNHGLGICNIFLVNLDLVGKFHWMMVLDSPSLWREILVAIYVPLVVLSLTNGRSSTLRSTSPWWKGVSILSSDLTTQPSQFMERIYKNVGSSVTSFWDDSPIGPHPMKSIFPSLYHILLHQNLKVRDVSCWDDGVIFQDMQQRWDFFGREHELVGYLLSLIQGNSLSKDMDLWQCRHGKDDVYPVAFLYSSFLVARLA